MTAHAVEHLDNLTEEETGQASAVRILENRLAEASTRERAKMCAAYLKDPDASWGAYKQGFAETSEGLPLLLDQRMFDNIVSTWCNR